MRARVFTWLNLAFATIVALGVFVQAYLIAAYASGAGDDARQLHETVGVAIVHPAELFAFLTALLAFWRRWWWIGLNLLLIVLGTVQIFLAPPDEDPASGWVHGLHGLLALFVLVLAAVILHHDLRVLGLMRRRATAPPGPHA